MSHGWVHKLIGRERHRRGSHTHAWQSSAGIMEAPTQSTSDTSTGMIDMNDVSLALQHVKGAQRLGSTNSLASWRTTPETSPARSESSSSSGSSSSGSGDEDEGKDGGGGGGGGGRRGIAYSRSVRWGDEQEGGELVSEVRTTPDFWEEMVFGGAEGGGNGGGDGEPTELCRFVTELTRGVEATLVFPSMGGMSKKRRRVVLYTDDNGVSISWLKRGGSGGGGGGGGGGSKAPYRIRCETLLEVRDKTLPPTAGSGGEPCCEIGLKWLPQPTWSKRSVKVVDIQTESPGVFARGMLQLLTFNTDLQS